MNLQQLNHIMTSGLDLVAGLTVPCAIAYAGGYLYGTINNVDKVLTARAFTISVLVYYAFQAIVYYAAERDRKDHKRFYTAQLVGTDVLGAIQIAAYRKMKIIGTIGTTILSTFLLIGTLIYINKLDH
jgi:hypothetical protein